MDSTRAFLAQQISIMFNDNDPRDAEFIFYNFGQNDQDTKSYTINQLTQVNAILISHRVRIHEHGYGIDYIHENIPCLMHEVASEDFIDVIADKKFTHEKLAVIIKNCTPELQQKILSYLENKKLDAIIERNNGANHLVF